MNAALAGKKVRLALPIVATKPPPSGRRIIVAIIPIGMSATIAFILSFLDMSAISEPRSEKASHGRAG